MQIRKLALSGQRGLIQCVRGNDLQEGEKETGWHINYVFCSDDLPVQTSTADFLAT